MKKCIIPFVLAIVILSSGQKVLGDSLPKIYAKGAVLIEQSSGRVLYERNAYEKMSMASTTKIMTCLLAIESGRLDEIVTTSQKASAAPPVKLHLKVGEKQRLGDLVYALMLQSNNDAAVAIAEHLDGSVEQFCEHMTIRAKELGANSTCFKTPNGLDAPGHFSTAYDMAIIGAYALRNPEFEKIVTTTNISIPTVSVEGSRTHDLQNKSRFIYSYPNANGIKTGFTNQAGHCFVGAAKKDNMQLVATALASGWGKAGKSRKYTDVINMMNFGFENYKMYSVLSDEESQGEVPIKKAIVKSIAYRGDTLFQLPLTSEEYKQIEIKKVIKEELCAPIKEGDLIGEIQIICQGTLLKQIPLVAVHEVPRARIWDRIINFIKS